MFVTRCMAFEISAQELCDIVIEKKVAIEGWSLGDCIAALSCRLPAVRLALSSEFRQLPGVSAARSIPENLDLKVVNVMTQEAVRLGVPAGSDWRFGLAANDTPLNAPIDLILGHRALLPGLFRGHPGKKPVRPVRGLRQGGGADDRCGLGRGSARSRARHCQAPGHDGYHGNL
jgi:hypothetical protein